MLAEFGVCCLGTINLTQFLNQDKTDFDYEELKKYVGYLVRFLDNVNTLSETPLPEYTASMRDKRRIGCGVMGWGSALVMMKIPFNSDKAKEIQEKLMSEYARAAYMASIDLAEERGMFKYCDPVKHAEGEFIKRLKLPEEYMTKLRKTGIRNSSLLSQQPNGNSSIYANIVTGGIEPMFMAEYIRTVICPVTPEHIREVTPNFSQGVYEETSMFKWVKEGDENILRGVDEFGTVFKIDKNRGLTKEVLCEDYGVRYLKSKSEYDPNADYIQTTEMLSVEDHINSLKAFAYYTDSACSKCMELETTMVIIGGKVYYLEDLEYGEEDTFLEVDIGVTKNHRGTMTKVKSTYNNGKKPGIRLMFSDGSSSTSTLSHKYYASDEGFIKASDLKIGNRFN